MRGFFPGVLSDKNSLRYNKKIFQDERLYWNFKQNESGSKDKDCIYSCLQNIF